MQLKVVVRACYGAYFVVHALAPNFASGGPAACMMLPFRISVQLSLEPLIAHVVCNFMHEQLPLYFYLIPGLTHFDCFDRSVYFQCALCNKTWLKFRKAFCLF